MRKLVIPIVTISALLMALISSPALAAVVTTESCGTSGTFTITDNVVTGNSSCAGLAAIPASVTSIGNNAFSTATSLTTVTFGSGSLLTSIGRQAFYNAINLTSITLPDGVTTIGESAFHFATSLTSIAIPDSVTTLGNNAFFGALTSSLTTVTFGAGSLLTSIGSSAFQGQTNLTSITIPAGVTSIGAMAFFQAEALPSINIPAGVTSIGNSTFYGAKALTSITIPASVTTIGPGAFSWTDELTTVTFGAGSLLTSIDAGAFSMAKKLASITIPAGVTSIGEQAFLGASALTSISIPAGVTSIGNYVFANTSSLTSITLPAGVTSIGNYAFGASALTSITIPAGVTSIGSNAFLNSANLTNVYFLGNAPTVGADAFKSVGTTPMAQIKSTATGFSAPGAAWNDLTVGVGVYNVSFNSKSGSAVSDGGFPASGTVSAPTPPTLSGSTFGGWSATDGGTAVVFPYSPGVTSDITLYAIWTAIPSSRPRDVTPVPVLDCETEAASATFAAKERYSGKFLAKKFCITIVSSKAVVSMKVAKASKKICVATGKTLKTLRAGACKVTFTVQEPKPAEGKKPLATKTVKILTVQPRV